MCVIAIADEKRMTEDHIKKMWAHNRDGGGIAWREHGKVQWRKGLKEDELKDLCLTVPLPYIAHFRIASCGGTLPELTHPFPIQKTAPLALKGATSGNLLFHNGHLGRWKDILLNMATGKQVELPPGAWSDTRLMAWVASYCGTNILPFFDEKLVSFGPTEIEVWGVGWQRVDDLYVSNRSWETYSHQSQSYNVMVCRYRQCKKDRVNNTVFCELHTGGVETILFRGDETKEDDTKEKGLQGVTPIPTTFRGSLHHEGPRNAQQEAVEEVAQSLRGSGEEGQTGTSNLALIKAQEDIAWVRRLNPKVIRRNVLPLEEDPYSTMID